MNSPSRKPCRQTSRSSKATILLHILLIVEFILPLLGEKTIETVTAAPILPVQARSIGKQAIINPSLPTFSWAAYNDTFVGAGEPNTNITNVRLSSRSDGNALKNFSDGSTITGITFEVRVGTDLTPENWSRE